MSNLPLAFYLELCMSTALSRLIWIVPTRKQQEAFCSCSLSVTVVINPINCTISRSCAMRVIVLREKKKFGESYHGKNVCRKVRVSGPVELYVVCECVCVFV